MTVATALASVLRIVLSARATLLMALLACLAWSSPAAAQRTSPRPTIGPEVAYEDTLRAVLAEVHAMRVWLERSSGPGASQVLAIGQRLQAQEVRIAGTARRLDDMRARMAEAHATRTAQSELLADLERGLGAEAQAAFRVEIARTRANMKRAQILETALQQQEREIAAELEEVKREADALSERLKALERPQGAPAQ
jgi:hypothetical protein